MRTLLKFCRVLAIPTILRGYKCWTLTVGWGGGGGLEGSKNLFPHSGQRVRMIDHKIQCRY